MPQQVEFSHAAALFGLRFVRATNWREVVDAASDGFKQPGTTLLEVAVSPKAGAECLQRLLSEVATW